MSTLDVRRTSQESPARKAHPRVEGEMLGSRVRKYLRRGLETPAAHHLGRLTVGSLLPVATRSLTF